MKTTLLLVLLLIATGSVLATTAPDPNQGRWINITESELCDDQQVCAEWLLPGGRNNGITCCVSRADISSHSFSDCQAQFASPRDPDTEP